MGFLFDISKFGLSQIVVFGCFFMGIYYFSFFDNGSLVQSSTEDVQTKTKQLSAQITKKQKELEDIRVFEQEILQEEETVKYFLNFIPSSLTYTHISTLLIREAKASGVNIGLKQDQKMSKSKQNEEYQALKVQLTVNGAFSQILLFLSRLTAQKRILIVNDIDMKMNRNTKMIEAKMNIEAYRYEKPKKNP